MEPSKIELEAATEILKKLIALDNKAVERINDLYLLASNAPNQYELGALALSAKVIKYKKK